jgi:hypothetical protein
LPLAIALDGDHRLGDPVDQLLFLLRGEDVLDDSTRRAHGTEFHSFVVLCEPDGVAGQSAVHLILLDDLLAGVREAHGWRRAESRSFAVLRRVLRQFESALMRCIGRAKDADCFCPPSCRHLHG